LRGGVVLRATCFGKLVLHPDVHVAEVCQCGELLAVSVVARRANERQSAPPLRRPRCFVVRDVAMREIRHHKDVPGVLLRNLQAR